MKHTIHKLRIIGQGLSICGMILIGIGMIILLKKYLTRIGKKQFV